jgi:hypothetical protein
MMRAFGAALALGALMVSAAAHSETKPSNTVVLEDFKTPGSDAFPKGWQAQRNEGTARQSYRVQSENGQSFLAARNADQRVYKKIGWSPKGRPVVTWRWRLKSAPAGAEPLAAVFVSLDTDLLVIPVATKYVWSGTKAKGTVSEGGVFDATEIVLRSGAQPVGEWVEERVNAYEDFKRIHKHEPNEQAWGVSLLAGPGVEIDFGPIAVSAP